LNTTNFSGTRSSSNDKMGRLCWLEEQACS